MYDNLVILQIQSLHGQISFSQSGCKSFCVKNLIEDYFDLKENFSFLLSCLDVKFFSLYDVISLCIPISFFIIFAYYMTYIFVFSLLMILIFKKFIHSFVKF